MFVNAPYSTYHCSITAVAAYQFTAFDTGDYSVFVQQPAENSKTMNPFYKTHYVTFKWPIIAAEEALQ